MKFFFVKSALVAAAFVCHLASANHGVNLSEAISAAIGDGKATAAEKRQWQRDERRSYTNPNRSQSEEDRETRRKERQYRNSGRDNPKNNRSFQQDRNRRNRRDCEDYGEDCNYNAGTDDYRNDDYHRGELARFGRDVAAKEEGAMADNLSAHLRGAISAAIGDGKKNAAEKRQWQRDERRSYTNPNRSQSEEDRETRRKERQSRNSGRDNPKNNRNFQQDRNRRNRRDCEDYGEDCNYSADTDDYRNDDFTVYGRKSAAEAVMIAEDKSSSDSNRSNKNGNRKDSASQKRAGQRDKRRSYTNPNRSQAEEDREESRKRNQAENRNNNSADPNNKNYGNRNYESDRNAKNRRRCEDNGTNCNYEGQTNDDLISKE